MHIISNKRSTRNLKGSSHILCSVDLENYVRGCHARAKMTTEQMKCEKWPDVRIHSLVVVVIFSSIFFIFFSTV